MAEEETLGTREFADFLRIIEDWKKRWNVGERALYRGHRDFNWILMAKLFRDPDVKPMNKNGDDPHEVERQLEAERLAMAEAHAIEHRLFHDFSRYLYAYRPELICVAPERGNNTKAIHAWRQLAIAQHYGLPTRLIDFTTNVLVALFFAVEGSAARRQTTKGEFAEQDSAVWCVEVPNRLKVWQVWKKEGIWLSPLEFAEEGSTPPIANFQDTAFVPEHIDERIRAQGGVFMCEPWGKKSDWQLHRNLRDKTEAILDRQTEEKKRTRTLKIRIPKDARGPLREQLDTVGINRANLFPDLASAAEYLKWAVYQRKQPYFS